MVLTLIVNERHYTYNYIEQWTVPQVSIMIILHSTWSMLIQWIMVIMSGDNLAFVNTKRILPVCDEPYHMNERTV